MADHPATCTLITTHPKGTWVSQDVGERSGGSLPTAISGQPLQREFVEDVSTATYPRVNEVMVEKSAKKASDGQTPEKIFCGERPATY